MAEHDDGRMEDCHQMLLRLAGNLPDDVMTQCREQLARGGVADRAREVVSSILSDDLSLASSDLAVLTALLEEAGDDASVLADVEVDDSDPLIWDFMDVGPAPEIEDGDTEDPGAVPRDL